MTAYDMNGRRIPTPFDTICAAVPEIPWEGRQLNRLDIVARYTLAPERVLIADQSPHPSRLWHVRVWHYRMGDFSPGDSRDPREAVMECLAIHLNLHMEWWGLIASKPAVFGLGAYRAKRRLFELGLIATALNISPAGEGQLSLASTGGELSIIGERQ